MICLFRNFVPLGIGISMTLMCTITLLINLQSKKLYPRQDGMDHRVLPQPDSTDRYILKVGSQEWNFNPHILSQGNPPLHRPFVFGIPHRSRKGVNYLFGTLRSLFKHLSRYNRGQVLVVVSLSNKDTEYNNSVMQRLRLLFPIEILLGVLEVITPAHIIHSFCNKDKMPPGFVGNHNKFVWTCCQGLDFSFLMNYCEARGKYYLQLEDDVLTLSGYFTLMKEYLDKLENRNKTDWLYIRFSRLGFIGKLFKVSDLKRMVHFILLFHKQKPVDWLLDYFLELSICNPEVSQQACNRLKNKLRLSFVPSLFQHVGVRSSLTGKLQLLKDPYFRPLSWS